ncbi:protein kinase domain-containing protein [Nostoc sp. DedSLP04]|uniref:protein kinase domain-containing protein n=1 Tax=Nostoc sp. DedSLP04 TaxID=3075401 RepID=UPI002AD37D02|nr:protein kinase [Nostoc sp. DedSLP04]MDZ8035389.1 protein kinase [Nostoc sp. DedSLP04]
MSRKSKFFIPRPDRRLGDRYELLECLGDGSYGWVWRSQRLKDNQIVAVKIPKEQGATNEELAEGSALVGAEPHPNVIKVFWMGRVPPEREWYLIEMEYFPSLTLSQLLDKGEQGFVASYKRLLDIYQQVLAGVEHLHRLGMSHGDIKPQNILVSGDQVKLTDFGCSILPDDMYARSRENGGTILYSAPEIVGSSVKGRSAESLFKADIYSLGVLIYHLVTARLPHDTLSQVARHTPFPRPREINSSVSPALEHFILRCLAFEPANRWESLSEMAIAFKRVARFQMDYQPIRILPPRQQPSEDWSTQTLRLLEAGAYSQVENVAYSEFESSSDPHAFLLMITAAYRDGRYFDCLRDIEAHLYLLNPESPVKRDLCRITLAAYIQTRQIHSAIEMVEKCLGIEGELPDLLVKKASLLGLQAKYEDAAKILLSLNREHPKSPAILKRLVLVFEQMRDTGKATAFLRAYLKIAPDEQWAKNKLEQLNAIGVR